MIFEWLSFCNLLRRTRAFCRINMQDNKRITIVTNPTHLLVDNLKMVKVDEVFAAAAELEGASREAFLNEQCATPEIRKKVMQLLSAHDRANDFLETPPIEIEASSLNAVDIDTKNDLGDPTIVPFLQLLEKTDVSESLGRLDNYEIESVIGRGGMGVVFKAFDTKLKRNVAIKMLPWSFSGNPKYRKRFLREAESAAQVSHPNIVTIYSIEDSHTPYIVMEIVAGESLRERVQRVGKLPADEVICISKTNSRGIVSRSSTESYSS